MGMVFTLVLVAAVLTWCVKVWRERRADDGEGPALSGSTFRVRFRGGRVLDVQGTIPRNMLNAFEDIAFRAGLEGEVRLSGRSDLHFSLGIPEGVRQQMRNAFSASFVH